MKFSILVPVYNVEKYLHECLDSIAGQTFEDFEVILVDDGSTDCSNAICSEYTRIDSRFHLIRQPNQGLLIARRTGIRASRGEYILFVDSDDALREDALEFLNGTITRYDADIIQFQASRDCSLRSPYFNYEGLTKRLLSRKEGSFFDYLKVIATTHSLHQMCCKCIRRIVVDQTADYSRFCGLQYGEDLLQILPIVDKAESIYFSPEILYYYRINLESISHSVSQTRMGDIKNVRNRLIEYAKVWDEKLLPYVNAGSCEDILAYSIQIVRKCPSIRMKALQGISVDAFVKESYAGASFRGMSTWKRLGIYLIAKGRLGLFVKYISVLFFVVLHIKPDLAIHYL